MKIYKNIILDVGDVLFDYRWQDMLIQDYGLTKEDTVFFEKNIFDGELWKELDLGNFTMEEMIEKFRVKYPQYNDLFNWFFTHQKNMKVDRPRVWEKVIDLKKAGYNLYLLSNYSVPLLNAHLEDTSFLPYIDGKIVSGDYHMLKPDKEIYEKLFEVYNLDPADCLFIDDRPANIEGAAKCGMDGHVTTGQEELIEFLSNLIEARK